MRPYSFELPPGVFAIMSPPFNMFSRCPVLAVPAGMADNGIPTGVQLVGRPYDDETVFRAGAALERVRPWIGRPPLPAVS